MEDWERRWWDKTTEPYTVLHVEPRWPGISKAEFSHWYMVYYRSYRNRSCAAVYAKDHLDAYMQGLKRVAENKKKTDRMHEKKKEQTK